MHSGIIATLADVTLGSVTAFSSDPPLGLTKANLSIDSLGTAHPGDWIEAHAPIWPDELSG
ncbi:hypothetical protein ACFFLM_02140 [Deinococcus oregonensis]|uniref:Uncharacterized protein n=1 Tax=Deinococcus oregonensis TaxID=1805970 RepID=A0ABV6ATN0_9DEIO